MPMGAGRTADPSSMCPHRAPEFRLLGRRAQFCSYRDRNLSPCSQSDGDGIIRG